MGEPIDAGLLYERVFSNRTIRDYSIETLKEWGEAQREAGRAEAEPDVFKRVFGVATPEPPSAADFVELEGFTRQSMRKVAEAIDALTARVRSLEGNAR